MANALIASMYSLTETEGVFEITGTAKITMGGAGDQEVTWSATADSINPVVGGTWRDRIVAGVVTAAEVVTEAAIANVIFPDLVVVPVV